MVQYYVQENQSHEATLRHLYQLCFSTNSAAKNDLIEKETTLFPDSDLKSKRWTEIGFQGSNPRTDFRGGGYLSLLALVHFVKT